MKMYFFNQLNIFNFQKKVHPTGTLTGLILRKVNVTMGSFILTKLIFLTVRSVNFFY